MTFNREKLPKKRQAEMNRTEYASWKKRSLKNFGFFPVFQPFKEKFLLKNLSGNALRLYLYLGLMSGNESGETWVTIDTIAIYFNKSKRTISGWIKELEEAELIERMQLKPDGPAHTFLKPYGYEHMNDKNSLQKGKLSSSKQSSNDDILF